MQFYFIVHANFYGWPKFAKECAKTIKKINCIFTPFAKMKNKIKKLRCFFLLSETCFFLITKKYKK